jgi:hypothetical protein
VGFRDKLLKLDRKRGIFSFGDFDRKLSEVWGIFDGSFDYFLVFLRGVCVV